MPGPRLFLCGLVFALCMLASTAVEAQQPTRWSDPTGAWSLDLASANWTRGLGPEADGHVLITVPTEPPPANETRLCVIDEFFSTLAPGFDPAEVYARAAQLDAHGVEGALRQLQLGQTQVTHVVTDGVTVAVINAVSRGYRYRGRMFVTIDGPSAVLTTVSCLSTAGMAPDRDAEVDTILTSLHFPPPQAEPAPSLLAPDITPDQTAAHAAALDAQLAETLTLYREICFGAFPDDHAVGAAMSAHHAHELTTNQLRQYLHDDPGAGWTIPGATGAFVITIERPPFRTCAIRTMSAVGFPNAQPYLDFLASVEAGRTLAPMGQLDTIVGNARTRGKGDQYSGGGRDTDGLLFVVTKPASGVNPNASDTEVRFARQIIPAK